MPFNPKQEIAALLAEKAKNPKNLPLAVGPAPSLVPSNPMPLSTNPMAPNKANNLLMPKPGRFAGLKAKLSGI